MNILFMRFLSCSRHIGISLLVCHSVLAHADFNAGVVAASRGDYTSAQREWKAAANGGNPEAQFNLGALLLSGKLGQPDVKNAVRWIEKASQAGYLEASYALGMIYYTGAGAEIKQDHAKALKAFEIAAKKGSAQSQFSVGMLLLHGLAIKLDPVQAEGWLVKAAEQGHIQAQYNLGMFHVGGQGGRVDSSKGLAWFEKAAENGMPQAMQTVARMYMDGRGAERNLPKARVWFMKAADANIPEAQYALGIMAQLGVGQNRSATDALRWFAMAAKNWDRSAQFHLGLQYRDGDGVAADLVEAYKWFELAASGGHEDAHFLRAAVAAQLSDADRARGYKLAQEWFDANHSTPHRHSDMTPHRH